MLQVMIMMQVMIRVQMMIMMQVIMLQVMIMMQVIGSLTAAPRPLLPVYHPQGQLPDLHSWITDLEDYLNSYSTGGNEGKSELYLVAREGRKA